jgi:hypothetical protein
LAAAFGTRPWPKIENGSLQICHWQLKTTSPIANDKFSIFNSQWPSKLRFSGATSILFDLRLMIGTCFSGPSQLRFAPSSSASAAPSRRDASTVCRWNSIICPIRDGRLNTAQINFG